MKRFLVVFVCLAAMSFAAFAGGQKAAPGAAPAEPAPPIAESPPVADSPGVEWKHDFRRVVFQDKNSEMLFNGAWLPVDAEGGGVPHVSGGELFVPIAAAIRATHPHVKWRTDGDSVTATNDGSGASHTVTGQRVGGVLHVPLYSVAAAIGLHSLGWDAQSATLIVTPGVTVNSGVLYRDLNRQPEAWYGSGNSLIIARNLMVMQRRSGGWPRGTGQGGTNFNENLALMTEAELRWHQDNHTGDTAYFGRGITSNEIRFLLRMYEATRIVALRESAHRGLDATLNVQFATGPAAGGWPYYMENHTAHRGGASFNDDSKTTIMRLMFDISTGVFPSLDNGRRDRAARALKNGLDAILNLQIRSAAFSDGVERPTAWAQHYDRETGLPMWAREFEPPAISGSESIGVIRFLMDLPDPCERVRAAISNAVSFFAHVEIHGYNLVTAPSPLGNDRMLVPDPNATGLWARFICRETFIALFSDRQSPRWRAGEEQNRPGETQPLPGGILRTIRRADGTFDLAASFANLSHERRNGYSYVGTWARVLPELFSAWRARHGS